MSKQPKVGDRVKIKKKTTVVGYVSLKGTGVIAKVYPKSRVLGYIIDADVNYGSGVHRLGFYRKDFRVIRKKD